MIPQNCAVRRRIGCYVIKDREATTRAIEFKAKLGKPTLDQPPLPPPAMISIPAPVYSPAGLARPRPRGLRVADE